MQYAHVKTHVGPVLFFRMPVCCIVLLYASSFRQPGKVTWFQYDLKFHFLIVSHSFDYGWRLSSLMWFLVLLQSYLMPYISMMLPAVWLPVLRRKLLLLVKVLTQLLLMFQMPDVIKMRGIKTNWIDKVNVPLIAFFLFSALATLKPQAGMAVVPSAAPVQVRTDLV